MLIGSFFHGMSEFEEPDQDESVKMLISQIKLFVPIVTSPKGYEGNLLLT